jgi:ABC-type polysaccharide/polyol phosphate export permease
LVNAEPTIEYDSAQPRRPLIDEFKSLWTHRQLIQLLTVRDLTLRYKRSVLGVWWTLLNPLLTAAVMWLVFSQLFRRISENIPFIVYLLSGILLVSTFFVQGVLAAGSSLLSGSGILSKIRVPGEVFAFTAGLAAMANFLLGLIPLLVIMALTGTAIPWTVLLVPIPTFAMLCFVTGFGMLLAAAAVHFYDVLDFSRVLLTLSIWLVPTFYPLEMIPEEFQFIIKINPLFSYLEVFRGFVYRGEFAPAWNFAYMIGTALFMLAIGVWVFSKSWRQMVVKL